jgi:hypothetical protein
MARMIRCSSRLVLLALAGLAACVPDPCPTMIYEHCASPLTLCPMSWQAAEDPASWPCDQQITLKVCEDVWIAAQPSPDPGVTFYYNPSDSSLYRVEGYDAASGSASCIAGAGEVFDCVTPTTSITGTKGCSGDAGVSGTP